MPIPSEEKSQSPHKSGGSDGCETSIVHKRPKSSPHEQNLQRLKTVNRDLQAKIQFFEGQQYFKLLKSSTNLNSTSKIKQPIDSVFAESQ